MNKIHKRFAVQTLLWSLEIVIQINLEHDNITFLFINRILRLNNLKIKTAMTVKISVATVFMTQPVFQSLLVEH